MEPDLDKQLHDAQEAMEAAQARQQALKERVLSLMEGGEGQATLGERLLTLGKTVKDMEGPTAENALDTMLQQVKDVILGDMAEAQRLMGEYIKHNVNFLVEQQKQYNDLVEPDERVETLDIYLTKLEAKETGKKPKLG